MISYLTIKTLPIYLVHTQQGNNETQNGDKKMKVTLTSEYKKVVFTWNADLSECDFASIGASDEEVDAIVAANGHEGASVAGWETTIQ